MMPIGYWNGEEDAALQGLSMEAQIIYLRGIRLFADSNGLSGVARRISEQGLMETIQFSPDRGSKHKPNNPTRQMVRSKIDELVRAGLIERLDQPMVFRCILAAQDESVQMRNNRGTTKEQPRNNQKNNRAKPSKDAGSGVGEQPDDNLMTNGCTPEEQPTSPITNHHNTNTHSVRISNALNFDRWPDQPTPEVLADWIKIRKAKKSPLNQTAVNRMAGELTKARAAGYSVDDCLALCCERGWVGFKFEWMQNHEVTHENRQPAPVESFADRQRRQALQKFAELDERDRAHGHTVVYTHG